MLITGLPISEKIAHTFTADPPSWTLITDISEVLTECGICVTTPATHPSVMSVPRLPRHLISYFVHASLFREVYNLQCYKMVRLTVFL